jgi:hypothetical protein
MAGRSSGRAARAAGGSQGPSVKPPQEQARAGRHNPNGKRCPSGSTGLPGLRTSRAPRKQADPKRACLDANALRTWLRTSARQLHQPACSREYPQRPRTLGREWLSARAQRQQDPAGRPDLRGRIHLRPPLTRRISRRPRSARADHHRERHCVRPGSRALPGRGDQSEAELEARGSTHLLRRPPRELV